tara:strand:- start:17934 stop:18971 length:1038 start_codon:yes stop_codon:yes gene_type:complete
MADWTDDSNFFWQSKYGSSERFQTMVDGTDALANGGKFVVSFHHLASGKEVFFKAFITQYQETFNSNWKPEEVYGRTDPIYTFANTRRTVSFGFDVPASSEQEAYENMGRLQKLSQMLYPTYAQTNEGQIDSDGKPKPPQYIITQSPLVRIKVMNLLTSNKRPSEVLGGTSTGQADDEGMTRRRMYGRYRSSGDPNAENGILAAINNLGINTDFGNTTMFEVGPNVILPQNFTVSLDFSVIHEKTIGFDTEGNAINPGLPFDVTLKVPDPREKVINRATYERRLQTQRDQQAAEDIAASRFRGALGGRRAQRAINRYDRKSKKGKADAYDEHLANEAQAYLDSGE